MVSVIDLALHAISVRVKIYESSPIHAAGSGYLHKRDAGRHDRSVGETRIKYFEGIVYALRVVKLVANEDSTDVNRLYSVIRYRNFISAASAAVDDTQLTRS